MNNDKLEHILEQIGKDPVPDSVAHRAEAQWDDFARKVAVNPSAGVNHSPNIKHSFMKRIKNMKLAPLAASLLLLAGLAIGLAVGRKYQPAPLEGNLACALPLRIALLEGTVLVRHGGTAYWQEVTPQTTLRLGDHLQTTAPAKITLDFDDRSFLTMNANSSLALTRWNGGVELGLNYGSVRASLQSPHPSFFVATPQGRIEALGTEFTVTVK
jgi:hypothetical protein